MSSSDYTFEGKIPFPSRRAAEIAYNVLRVDDEPPRSQVTKALELADLYLIVSLKAPAAKKLRVAVESFLDKVALVSETLLEFGPATTETYSYD